MPKSNWANTIDQAPFEAYAVTCGLTFTFGGLKISNEGEVESTDGHVDPRPVRRGELVGGLFYHNYPGGTGPGLRRGARQARGRRRRQVRCGQELSAAAKRIGFKVRAS